MPGGYTYGGDDDDSPTPEDKKRKAYLDKFNIQPDYNIRDVFWEIMAQYSMKSINIEKIKKYSSSRTALVKIGLSVVKNPESSYFGIKAGSVARYSLQMTLDADWGDSFIEIIEESYGENISKPFIKALKKLMSEKYGEKIEVLFLKMLKNISMIPSAVFYLKEINDKELILKAKKWLIVIARTDVEENQLNAMTCLSLLKKDPDVKKMLVALLSHWDPGTRMFTIKFLKEIKDDEVNNALERRLGVERDVEVKTAIKKAIGKKGRK